MTHDTPTSDEDHPLWHPEFMDLRDIDNFESMQLTYSDLQTQVNNLSVNDPDRHAANREMLKMYGQYIQAYNYHYRPQEYRPEMIAPELRVQSATPPDSETAAVPIQHPGYLTVPAPQHRSRARRESNRETGSSSQHSGTSRYSADSKPQKRHKHK
ncbi:hypothetical protein [Streptomyces olivaceus]|uniref:hypothetical protein n=1 Tax=Streptomyces olivaceus TaxID=47716 RepID=UPI0040573E6E